MRRAAKPASSSTRLTPWRPSSNSNTSRNGVPPIGSNGFGVSAASEPSRLPRPPHKITACRTTLRRLRHSPARKQALLDEAADNVPRGYVDLLDQRRRIRRRMQANVAAWRHLSTCPSGQTDSHNLLLSGGV